MRQIRKAWTALICLFLPSFIKPPLLRLAGHRVHRSARIGCSLVLVDRLYMGRSTRIGWLNTIKARRIVMRDKAYFGHLNWISGGLSIGMLEHGAIGHRNQINSDRLPGCRRRPQLRLGIWSKITAGHFVNCSETVLLGNYTTVAGFGSQLWTHGFVHHSEGVGRGDVRGKITIGNNVYIGSNCTLQPGITIANVVSVGSHASVAKSLLEPGVYVPHELRYIARTPEQRLAGLDHVVVTPDHRGFYWRAGGGALHESARRLSGNSQTSAAAGTHEL